MTVMFFESQGRTFQRDECSKTDLAAAPLRKRQGRGRLHALASEEQEVRTVLGHVKRLLVCGVSADDIAAVVPDDERWEGKRSGSR